MVADVLFFDVDNFANTKTFRKNEALAAWKNIVAVVDGVQMADVAKVAAIEYIGSLNNAASTAGVCVDRNLTLSSGYKHYFAVEWGDLADTTD